MAKAKGMVRPACCPIVHGAIPCASWSSVERTVDSGRSPEGFQDLAGWIAARSGRPSMIRVCSLALWREAGQDSSPNVAR